ncbi:MAG TPA: NAD-dependent epimerase/dehydratase family protein [Candidatus Dormibacteraeota bacterium]|nr:NAD-dependent epimerase/dehydratase family protein [Candidatus Dormibacteraeota bacterium]
MRSDGRQRDESWKGRVVLVTGAGGFVGSGLAAELLERGASVVGIVRDSPGLRLLEALGLHRRLDIISGSITDPGLVHRVINEYEVDTVFHLAAQAIVQAANRSPVPTFEANIMGTWTVLEAARLSPLVQRVVVASSDKAYGDQPVLPYREDTPLGGLYPYDASKACTDILARSYATTYPLPVAVVRCANIYGPGDLNWSRLIPGTIRSGLQGQDPIIRSDGRPERDYLFLDDAVAGYLSVAEHLPELSGQAVNLGTGRSVAVLELVELILRKVGDEGLKPRVLGEASGEIDRQCLGFDKARKVLGWEPATPLAEGIARTVPWYREHLSTGRIVALGSVR